MAYYFSILKKQKRLKNIALLSSMISSVFNGCPAWSTMGADELGMDSQTRVGSAFAGGGTRGVLPLTISKEIETRAKLSSLADGSDMMAGTSTGGFEAMGFSYGLSSDALRTIYYRHADDIFPKPMFLSHTILFLRSFFGPRYGADGLERTLKTYFGDATFEDLKVPTFVVSYDMSRRSTVLFDSNSKKRDFPFSAPGNFFLRDLLRATSAAPTYFPPAIVRPVVWDQEQGAYLYDALTTPNICIDGGVTGANDPSAILYSKMGDRFGTRKNLRIIDFGTGRSPMYLKNTDMSSAGILSWISPILDISLSSPTFLTNHLMNTYLGKQQVGEEKYRRYFDVNPTINPNMNRLDESDPNELIKLQYTAEDWVADNDELIDTIASIYRVRADFKREEAETFPDDAPSLSSSSRDFFIDNQIMSSLRRSSVDGQVSLSPRRNGIDASSSSPRSLADGGASSD